MVLDPINLNCFTYLFGFLVGLDVVNEAVALKKFAYQNLETWILLVIV